MKTIILVPANGILKKQDFLFDRLSYYFKNELNYTVILIHITEDLIIENKNFNKIIPVNNKDELISSLSKIKYDYIINRGWMHAYSFSAKLVKEFRDVIIIIKDWNFSTKEEYKFLFGDDSDFEAIEYIFKYAKNILSHFTKEQTKIWVKEYKVNENKFLFFPEYCNKINFQNKDVTLHQKKKVNLVHAGTVPPSSFPEEFFMTKGLLRSTKRLSKQGISTNLVVPPHSYDDLLSKKQLYKDLLYENTFNNNFNIYRGKVLDASILNKFDFGFFQIEYHTKNEYLNKYVVPSKFAFYLEAGIPIIINSKFIAVAELVKKNNLGIVFSNKDIDNLGDILQNITRKKYKEFIDNIKKFRISFEFSTKLNLFNEK